MFGASDILLFGIEKLITRIDVDASAFFWITRQYCQDELGRLSIDQFVDFCLLLGSSFLPTFPMFDSSAAFPGRPPQQQQQVVNIRDALLMFNSAGRSALNLCVQFEDDRRMQEAQYMDCYKRAFMSVKHHVIMDVDGKVGPLDVANAPSDMHEVIGQRLPDELYFYVSKGVLGPNVPNSLASGEVPVSLPLGIEDTDMYRRAVGDLLNPMRAQSICLLSNSLHRFYQTKIINVRTWYDGISDTRAINLKSMPSVKDVVQSWRINEDALPESVKKLPVSVSLPSWISFDSANGDLGTTRLVHFCSPKSQGIRVCIQVVLWKGLSGTHHYNEWLLAIV